MRKSLCPSIHKDALSNSTYIWCAACGEWNVVNGKAVR